jgi:hypothetical protein
LSGAQTEDLDLRELQKVTKYEGYVPTRPIVQWLWEILHGLSLEEKQKFLRFCTGSDRVPM